MQADTTQANDPASTSRWKEKLRTGRFHVVQALLAAREGRERHSSSPPFWDMNAPEKLLPVLPQEPPAPPLPLAQRRLRAETRPSPKKRAISWSEEQINKLQRDNKELRQKILDQKRLDVEKDQTISHLRQQNAHFIRQIERQTDMTQFANNIIVAVQDFQQAKSQQSDSSSDYELGVVGSTSGGSGEISGAISDIIRVYSET
jgi:hypothetical protein